MNFTQGCVAFQEYNISFFFCYGIDTVGPTKAPMLAGKRIEVESRLKMLRADFVALKETVHTLFPPRVGFHDLKRFHI